MVPETVTDVFQSNYNLKNSSKLQSKGIKIKTVMHGSETISSSGQQTWDILPTELKYIVSPILIKKKIRELTPKNCPCRLCKTYLQNIGFL